jgi:hypothetical protein
MEVAGNQLILSGRVVNGDYRQFLGLIDGNPGIDMVILRDSPGGHAGSGYDIGAMIRSRQLKTAVSGYCRSSCSRMFLGGVERMVADDRPADRTHVGFHGNYDNNGQLLSRMVPRLQKFVIDHSDGKADIELVKRWTTLPNRNGFIYFFDGARLNRKDGISVFLCGGTESRSDYADCEKIAKTGYDLGIFTSTQLVTPNK